MRDMSVIVASIAIFCAALHNPGWSQTAEETNKRLELLFGQRAAYQKFFDDLKAAIAVGDKEAVASKVRYPLNVKISGETLVVNNANEFLANYKAIVSDFVRKAVLTQTYASLFINDEGVSIGDGTVWFSGTGDHMADPQVRIIAINPYGSPKVCGCSTVR